MVQSADYIYKKIKQENLLSLAFNKIKGQEKFPLVRTSFIFNISCFDESPNENNKISHLQVCTGHSLGGGTAAILAILLREEYPDVTCYAFSPPGGLLR